MTKAQLSRQLEKMGQRPYDDDLLQTAVFAVNLRLLHDDEVADVVREQSWKESIHIW